MAQSTKNVAAGKPNASGGVWIAPIGTSLPTNATSTLTSFTALGYVSDAGLQPARDTSVDKIKAWGGDVVAALLTDDSQSFTFTLLEVFSKDVNEFIYGASNVSVTAATSQAGTKLAISDTAYDPGPCVMVFEMFHNDKKMRIVLPNADPAVTGEDPFVDGGLNAYEITVEALKDSNGHRAHRYYDNDDKL